MSWIDLVQKEDLKPLPEKSILLSDNGISMVYRGNDGWIYKRTIPYFVNNEKMFLGLMRDSGFVPCFEQHDKYTLKVEDFGKSEEVTDIVTFVRSCKKFLDAKNETEIRHGDLTRPHIIVIDNEIKVIDWAESRLFCDGAFDKRREGDKYWLDVTMKELCGVGLYG